MSQFNIFWVSQCLRQLEDIWFAPVFGSVPFGHLCFSEYVACYSLPDGTVARSCVEPTPFQLHIYSNNLLVVFQDAELCFAVLFQIHLAVRQSVIRQNQDFLQNRTLAKSDIIQSGPFSSAFVLSFLLLFWTFLWFRRWLENLKWHNSVVLVWQSCCHPNSFSAEKSLKTHTHLNLSLRATGSIYCQDKMIQAKIKKNIYFLGGPYHGNKTACQPSGMECILLRSEYSDACCRRAEEKHSTFQGIASHMYAVGRETMW